MVFQTAELRKFLLLLKSRSPVTSLRDWQGAPAIILRHDVDLDPTPALDLARLEADCGVTSSFLFMTTSLTYNPLAPRNRRMIAEIDRLGFDVGLHFDPSVYEEAAGTDLTGPLEREAALLADIIGKRPSSVSIHNPSVHSQYPQFKGYRNAYDPAFFGEGRYLSDSRMKFRTDPYEFLEQAKGKTVQILLHPLHFTEQGGSYPDIFLSYVERFVDGVDKLFRINDQYASTLPDGLGAHVLKSARADKETP